MDRRRAIEGWLTTTGQAVGLLGLIAFGIEWIVTKQVNSLLVATAGGMYGLGKGGEALSALRQSSAPGHSPTSEGPGT